LVDLTAEQKLAGFIMGLSSRYQLRGYSSTQFQLLMPRKDIANHLGMAPETVSRMFKRLVNEQILDIDQTEVTILDSQKLKQLLGVCA
jgi:CRP/FNR family transcriptional regulator